MSHLPDSQFYGFGLLGAIVIGLVVWALSSIPLALIVARIIGRDLYDRPVSQDAIDRWRTDEEREKFDAIVAGETW